jgi:hypothetical protein
MFIGVEYLDRLQCRQFTQLPRLSLLFPIVPLHVKIQFPQIRYRVIPVREKIDRFFYRGKTHRPLFSPRTNSSPLIFIPFTGRLMVILTRLSLVLKIVRLSGPPSVLTFFCKGALSTESIRGKLFFR